MCQGRMARTKSIVAGQAWVRVSRCFLVMGGIYFDGRGACRADRAG
jgi:hypothetical protein